MRLWYLAFVCLAACGLVAWGQSDTVLIADTENARVLEVAADGSVVWSYGAPPVVGQTPAPLALPTHAERLPGGNTLITDRGQHVVLEVTPQGRVVWQYGTRAVAGPLTNPHMAIRVGGHTLIADRGNGRVLDVAADGTVQRRLTGFAGPTGVQALPNGNLLVTDCEGGRVVEVRPDGSTAWEFGGSSLRTPFSAERRPDGNTLIADCGHHRVVLVDGMGQVVRAVTSGLSYPTWATMTPDGSVLVADTGHHRVVGLRADGTAWTFGVAGTAGSAGGLLHTPYAAVIVRAMDAPAQPPHTADLSVRQPHEPAYVGAGVVGPAGAQVSRGLGAPDMAPVFLVQVRRTGAQWDGARLIGDAGNRGWTVRYYEATTGMEITGQVTGEGWAPDGAAMREVRAEVTPGPGVHPGGDCHITVRAGGDAVGLRCQTTDGADIVQDSSDPANVTKWGAWFNSKGYPGYVGTGYLHDGGVKSGKSIRYSPILPVADQYAVYLRWPGEGRRISSWSAAVPADITTSAGIFPFTVNQQYLGGRWLCQGWYNFPAGQYGSLRLRTDGTTGSVIADGARFVQLPRTVIVDDADPWAVQAEGSWAAGTSPTAWEGGARIASGGGSVCFRPWLWTAGTYAVYLRWPERSDLAPDARVSIAHAGETAHATVNQSANGGAWRFIGAWPFDAEGDETISLLAEGASGPVAADAVRLVRVHSSYTVDNADLAQVTTTGAWTTSLAPYGQVGADYLHDGGTGKIPGKTVTFTPNLETPGRYAVLMNWPGFANRSAGVPVTVTAMDGTMTTRLDQRQSPGWVLLDVRRFAAGMSGSVTVGTARTQGVVVADAVRFVRADADVIMDNTDREGVTITGLWGESRVVAGFQGTNVFYAGKSQGGGTVRYAPRLPEPGNYTVYLRWTASSNRASNAPVAITHAGGDDVIPQDMRSNGGMWMPLGTFPFAADGAEGVTVSTAGADGLVIADAVRFVKQQ